MGLNFGYENDIVNKIMNVTNEINYDPGVMSVVFTFDLKLKINFTL